jgi:hypothetical protein
MYCKEVSMRGGVLGLTPSFDPWQRCLQYTISQCQMWCLCSSTISVWYVSNAPYFQWELEHKITHQSHWEMPLYYKPSCSFSMHGVELIVVVVNAGEHVWFYTFMLWFTLYLSSILFNLNSHFGLHIHILIKVLAHIWFQFLLSFLFIHFHVFCSDKFLK